MQKLFIRSMMIGLVTLVGLWLSSCELFEYTRYDIKLKSSQKNQIQKNLDKLLSRADSDKPAPFSFAFISDSQNFFDRLTKSVEHFNDRDDCEFALIGGDITEYSLPAEFKLSLDNLRDLDQPFLNIVGNHDALGVGQELYSQMFGPFDYSFVYRRVKFVLLNTNSREFGLTGKVPDAQWLAKELVKTDDHDYVIVAAHSGIYPEDNNMDQRLFPELDRILSNTPHLLAVIHGHGHSSNLQFPLTNSSIPMYEVGAVAKKRYSVFHLNGKDLKEEIINF